MTVAVGDLIKVLLPGERPWAEVLTVYPNGQIAARIDNKLFHEYSDDQRRDWEQGSFGEGGSIPKLHDFKCDDVVVFEFDAEEGWWMPAESRGSA